MVYIIYKNNKVINDVIVVYVIYKYILSSIILLWRIIYNKLLIGPRRKRFTT